jgi:hypothetical protein
LFDPTIDLQVPLEVQYGDRRTRAWNRIIGTLQTEYGRVVSRAKG